MTIEDDIALLARVPSFRPLGAEALRVLAIGAESFTLQGGEVLFREGETADGGFVVEEGLLAASSAHAGGDQILLSRGTLLGELALITETRRPVTVAATEPSSVMRLPRALFLRMLEGYPDVAERLRGAMIERVERMARELGGLREALDLGAAPEPAADDKGQ